MFVPSWGCCWLDAALVGRCSFCESPPTPAQHQAPALPQLSTCTYSLDTKGCWAQESCKPFLLGTSPAPPDPTHPCEMLFFFPKKTRGPATTITCLVCNFSRPAPGLRTTAVTEAGLPVTRSACGAVCLSCCVFPRRTAAQECYRGCLVWICQASLNRPQPDLFLASQFS